MSICGYVPHFYGLRRQPKHRAAKKGHRPPALTRKPKAHRSLTGPKSLLAGLPFLLLFTPSSTDLAAEALHWESIPGGKFAHLPPVSAAAPGFKKMTATGIAFTNALPAARLLENQIRYNGCGVAAGDIDGDGLCDLFFCSLEGRSHLFKNLGNWQFVDITDTAGVACDGLFTSGAVLADVDGDGDLDLLVNAYGAGTRLFLNDGHGRFTEFKAAGLLQHYTAMSLALADIDGNGTLDLYVPNYSTTTIADNPGISFNVQRVNGKLTVVGVDGVALGTNNEMQARFFFDETTGTVKQNGEPGVLYLNLGKGHFEPQSWTGGRFLDEAGKPLAAPPYDWGLSAMFRDLNGDGLPDLYVCNDLFSPDRVWINQGNGRFRAGSNFAVRHMCDSSMGVDFADINRDGIDDFFSLDMLSRHHYDRLVQVLGLHHETSIPGDIDNRPPYNRNMLFLGRGDGTFAEIAHFAGLEASEWSWMPVFLDVDLDGFEDVLVPTGYFRDSLNKDLKAEFERQLAGKRLSPRQRLELQQRVFPLHALPNLAFRNRGDLTFTDASDLWGFNDLGISQGMCLADLDNDGDLDVVVNNFGAPPTLYRNEASKPRVAVRLLGAPPNTRGIGARITFLGGPVPQSQQIICGGRFLSGDDAERVFAAGDLPGPFSIEVDWPAGRRSLLTNVQPNCLYEVAEAQAQLSRREQPKPKPLFKDVSIDLKHTHREAPFDDFARQPLLPRKLSQAGPGLAWTDINGDGWPDLLVGGGRSGMLGVLLNDGKGHLRPVAVPPSMNALRCEQGTVLAIPETHGSLLLVAQGNYESPMTNSVQPLRVSAAGFQTLPGLAGSEDCPGPMALADVDGDGQLDLFVGGRLIPGKYPSPSSSTLWKGQPGGTYARDAASDRLFKNIGLVNAAVFTDLDGDGWPDLILACDWGPLRLFHYDHGQLRPWNPTITSTFPTLNPQPSTLNQLTGWWNGVATGDFDGDGRMDIVASNWGRNTRYQRYRAAALLKICFGDWNGNGSVELLEAVFDPDLKKNVPIKSFDAVRDALPWVAGRFSTYGAYAKASLEDVLGERMKQSTLLGAVALESMVFLNRGDHFEARPLPPEAQFAPAFGICVGDLDGDGAEDIFLAQNFYPVDAEGSRYDAGRGLLLRGDGHGNFTPVSGQVSGLEIYGDQRGAALCDYDKDGRVDLAVSENGGPTKLFHNELAKPGIRVRLAGPAENPAGFGAQIRLLYADGQGPIREVHAGSGYWSQDDVTQVLGQKDNPPTQLWVRWPGGKVLTYPLAPQTKAITANISGVAESR